MLTTKVASAAALLVVLGGAAGCGSSNSSSASAAGAPTDADQSSFCANFKNLSDSTTPKEAAAAFQKVGTPSGIPADARAGYETLVNHLGTMGDSSSSADLSAMEKSLSTTEQADVRAFVIYLAKECAGDLPSAPAS